jgi:hypothetical protein
VLQIFLAEDARPLGARLAAEAKRVLVVAAVVVLAVLALVVALIVIGVQHLG